MKKTLLCIGIVLHAIYYIPALLSLVVSNGFDLWILAMVGSFPVIAIYFIDAIKAFKKRRTNFCVFRLIAVIVLIPLCAFIGCTWGIVYSIIWNVYFLIIFAIQLKSLFIK